MLGTAIFSYAVVDRSTDRLSTGFAIELSQNLYFVGLILTYILWGAVMKLRETRTRLVQFVLSLGLYFSAYAACYALANMVKTVELVAVHKSGTGMPAAALLDDYDDAPFGRFTTGHGPASGGAAMMAALIFVVSLATLFMFFVSYCRSMMASAAQHELSEEVRDVTGIKQVASARDYDRVVQILQLCPERPERSNWTRRRRPLLLLPQGRPATLPQHFPVDEFLDGA